MKRFNSQKIFGFTLLEILLVIVILGALATIGLALYQQITTANKVKKSSSQIQQFLQAASVYYLEEGHWPNNNDTVFIDKYLPFNVTQAPWNGVYSYGPAAGDKKFQVFFTFDNSVAVQEAKVLLGQLQSALPNAVIDSNNPRLLLAETSIPYGASGIQPTDPLIATMGKTAGFWNGTKGSISFNCPTGWLGRVVMIPNYLAAPTYGTCQNRPMTRGIALASASNASSMSSLLPGVPGIDCGTTPSPIQCNVTDQANNTYTCSYVANVNSYIGDPDPPTLCSWVDTTPNSDNMVIGFAYIGWCYNPNANKQVPVQPL